MEKIARHAPGARVYIRLIVENSLADWPLSRKFGWAVSLLPSLLDCARDLGLVAEAGHIAAEVMLVSRRSADDLHRGVYLDIGRFSGLAETEGEAIRYQLKTPHDGGETGPCVLAGPSCDSADILYENALFNRCFPCGTATR